MAILDTNILIDLLRRRPNRSSQRTVALVRGLVVAGEVLLTTRFNVAELYVGAELAETPLEDSARIDRNLVALRILEFDDASARAYGRIEATLRRIGQPIGDFDALIASIALQQGQKLVTRNPRHFQGIVGLDVISCD